MSSNFSNNFNNKGKWYLFFLSFAIIVLVAISYRYWKENRKCHAKIFESELAPFTNHNGIIIKDKNGLDILLMSNDDVSKIIFLNKEWEPHLQNAIRQLVKPGDKVVSLGGHIGAHALLISKVIGSAGKLFVFEPNPNTLRFLKANFDLNNVKNASIYEKAAYSENTKIQFFAKKDGNTGTSHIQRSTQNNEDDKASELTELDAVSLDSIGEIDKIDVLQMDVEGAEWDVILGAKKLIDNSPNLLVLQEWSPFWLKDVSMYLSFWRERGFKIAKITKTGLEEMTDEELKSSDQCDILLTKDLENIKILFKPL
jgi:FkbM family methyltransferase